jgi:hypothetical protein
MRNVPRETGLGKHARGDEIDHESLAFKVSAAGPPGKRKTLGPLIGD